jgi:DnaJ-class molecular chaperone
MSAFNTAQRAFEEPPDDEPDYTCEECGGTGCWGDYVCPVCEGHGTIEGVVADEELERQIEQQEERRMEDE